MSYGYAVPKLPFRRLPGRPEMSDSESDGDVAPKRRRLK